MKLYPRLLVLLWSFSLSATELQTKEADPLQKVWLDRNDQSTLQSLFPIVRCSFKPTKYESLLMTELRNANTDIKQFRNTSEKIGEILIGKVIECLPTQSITIETPVTTCSGEVFIENLELVSIMRSGDALLETFMKHFPDAHINKILIQRDEKTTEPHFLYMKLSPSVASGNYVVITEPMIATGGSLITAITLLKKKGVAEDRIIIAAICAAPEGVSRLSALFPKIQLVFTVLDENLNEKNYIVPGLGDFGDRYFGTAEEKPCRIVKK